MDSCRQIFTNEINEDWENRTFLYKIKRSRAAGNHCGNVAVTVSAGILWKLLFTAVVKVAVMSQASIHFMTVQDGENTGFTCFSGNSMLNL